ncbi:hypothetical protein PR001_g24238 [Phytophthora rubi]|uniref:Retrotransposon gag domain-containing protein n=1 Tax=Phytophthora rubi TaxID=129364 RepID=A0A6A3IJ02_9STRA|nr:hypothetical protein PR002_g24349 [Phytophthora rubi]KAE8980595.1 hypothetical protein PR001_g24238 [Phytophthora rubi]
MVRRSSTQEGEREEAGRGSASRVSRRVQGLPPEETKSLDEVKREAWKANAAKRKAAEEKKKLAAAEEQTSSGLDVQDAHQVLSDGGQGEDPPDDVVSVIAGDEVLRTPALGMPEDVVKILEDPAWRLEGAPNDVSLTVDGVSDSPQPDEEIEERPNSDTNLQEEVSMIKKEKRLSTVQKDKLPDASVTARPPGEPHIQPVVHAGRSIGIGVVDEGLRSVRSLQGVSQGVSGRRKSRVHREFKRPIRSPRSAPRSSECSRRSGHLSRSAGSTGLTQEVLDWMSKTLKTMAKMEEEIAQVGKQGARVEKENVSSAILPNLTNVVQMTPEIVEALRAEGALSERQRFEAALGDFQAQLELEKNRQALELAELNAQLEYEVAEANARLEIVRNEIFVLREAREAALSIQKYYANKLRGQRTSTAQADSRNFIPTPSQAPVPVRVAQDNADSHYAIQLQSTLRGLQQDKVKNDAVSKSRSTTQVKTEQSSETRGSPGRTPSGGSDPLKRGAGKSESKRDSTKEGSKRRSDAHDSDPDSDSGDDRASSDGSDSSCFEDASDPHDSDPDSDSGDDSASSDGSDSSCFEDATPNAVDSNTYQIGTTVFTYKPYGNASVLGDFNEKASLPTRIRWLEKFQSCAVQEEWSDKMRIHEMKLRLPSSVRDWRYNLDEPVRCSWKRFLKAFKEKYCKARMSDSERYYIMVQKKKETPLEFFYRLNRVADKAGINFRKSSKVMERHFKNFTKKLLDSSLRATLQGYSLRNLEDLEFILKQYEKMRQDDNAEIPSPRREPRTGAFGSKSHEDLRKDWNTFQKLKALALQSGLKLPGPLWKQIVESESNSGEGQLNL